MAEDESTTYLTGKQKAFVDAWFSNGFNATRAAEAAGYQGSYDTLRKVGSENLTKGNIQAEIQRRWAEHGATGEEVIAHLVEIMRADVSRFYNEHGMLSWDKIRQNGHLVKRVTDKLGQERTIEMYDRMKAIELVGKALGLFREKVEHEGGLDLKIVVDI